MLHQLCQSFVGWKAVARRARLINDPAAQWELVTDSGDSKLKAMPPTDEEEDQAADGAVAPLASGEAAGRCCWPKGASRGGGARRGAKQKQQQQQQQQQEEEEEEEGQGRHAPAGKTRKATRMSKVLQGSTDAAQRQEAHRSKEQRAAQQRALELAQKKKTGNTAI